MAKKQNTLIILDLDQTLIYASFFYLEDLNLLLKYSGHLNIFERPHAREFVKKCVETGDIIVYTTAVADYAENVCDYLTLKYRELLSRKDCSISDDQYLKKLKKSWLEEYDRIFIVDDSPNIWEKEAFDRCTFLVPEPFVGDPDDKELIKLQKKLDNSLPKKSGQVA